jgi:hypothetical protein
MGSSTKVKKAKRAVMVFWMIMFILIIAWALLAVPVYFIVTQGDWGPLIVIVGMLLAVGSYIWALE